MNVFALIGETPNWVWIWKYCFFRSGKNWDKNQDNNNNKLNPHTCMMPSQGIKPWPCWWEASGLTAPLHLLPLALFATLRSCLINCIPEQEKKNIISFRSSIWICHTIHCIHELPWVKKTNIPESPYLGDEASQFYKIYLPRIRNALPGIKCLQSAY